jgi:hypothetical protein
MIERNAGPVHRDPSPWDSRRLWSLWDMLKVSALQFIELGQRIADISTNLYMADMTSHDDPSTALRDDEREDMRQHLIKVWDVCNKLGLNVSGDLISSRVDRTHGKANVPESQREFDLLIDTVKSEIRNKTFLFIPAHVAKYYESDKLLSDQARAAFPSAALELRTAGSSLAAGFGTACVFHSMRALEHGLRALAVDVEVSFDVQQWQNVIDQIEAKVRQLGKSLPAGLTKTERLQFLSAASASFSHFKDGWRNHVMHTRASYDEAQANVVVDQVRLFLEAISSRLKEAV